MQLPDTWTPEEELDPAAPESNTLFDELDLVGCLLLQLVGTWCYI